MVSNKHNLLWYGAVGTANSKKEKLSVEHPVNIASVTKIYLAAAVLRLIEQGKFTLETAIHELLTHETMLLLQNGGYHLKEIKVKHLLSNTSGIFDFVNTETYQNKTIQNPQYTWTQNEQITLAIKSGTKSFNPSEQFEYSETNYLLLAEIIAVTEKKAFHLAVKSLLKFDTLNLKNTWFLLQEKKPINTLELAEQTAKTYQVNSLKINPSFDAFGGGGLASTVFDLAQFGIYLFEGKIFENQSTLNLMTTQAVNKQNIPFEYGLGLAITQVNKHKALGHGGFWGTQLKYIPDLKLCFGVYVLERDAWPIYNKLIEALVCEFESN